MEPKERPIGIDLFSGVGGMSLGFEQAGFEIAAAIDIDPIHIETHAKNFPRCTAINSDLMELNGNDFRSFAGLIGKEIDVVFGGPPCGGFSIIGKRRYDDPRNQLLIHFARLVGELDPKYFVLENVRGLLVEPMTQLVDDFLKQIEQAGYSAISPIQILDASDFGVPQSRHRIFIMGFRKDLLPPEYPNLPSVGIESSKARNPSVWDAISDLPDIDLFEELKKSDVYNYELLPTESLYTKTLRGEIRDPDNRSPERELNGDGLSGCQRTIHNDETVMRFSETEPGFYEPVSRFYRLTKNGLSPTLRAGTGKEHGSYSAPRPIHPVYHRCISVREGARLHSFPDWFQFHKTKWHGFRQIGNAVPPLLARAVAKSVIELLE